MTISRSVAHGDVDEILLDAARAGDERAFGVLLERHRPGLEAFCGLMLGDSRRALYAMQEAALIAWRERELATATSSVRTWLYRIALRACEEALAEPPMRFGPGERLTERTP